MGKNPMRTIRFVTTIAIIAMAGAVSPASAATCPSQNFTVFLKVFMDNIDTQRAFTARPLHSVTIDNTGMSEPKPVTKMIAAPVFPVMFSEKEQIANGLDRTVSQLPGGNIQVTLVVPDTDIQTRYSFRKAGCWQLYRIDDDAL